MENNTVSIQYQEAVTLHQSILANAQVSATAFVEVCKGIKKMQIEKLYIELGYENFEDYTEKALNLGRSQAYKYIRLLDNLGEDFVHSNAQLGISKLALIASVEIKEDREEMLKDNEMSEMSTREIQELVEKVKFQGEQLSLLEEELEESKSVSADNKADELDKLKNELEETKKQLAQAEFEYKEECESAEKNFFEKESLEEKFDEAQKELEETKKQLTQETARKQAMNEELAEKVAEYANELEELKKKPVDVAVAEPSVDEIAKIKAEAEQKVKAELQEKLEKEHEQEIANIKAGYEKKLEAVENKVVASPEPIVTKDNTETFKAYFANAYDAFNKLVTFISNVEDNEMYVTKTGQLLITLRESVDNLEE